MSSGTAAGWRDLTCGLCCFIVGLRRQITSADGDAAKVRASVVRRQKTDRRDAEQLLQLLMEGAVSQDLGAAPGSAGRAAVAGASADRGGMVS